MVTMCTKCISAVIATLSVWLRSSVHARTIGTGQDAVLVQVEVKLPSGIFFGVARSSASRQGLTMIFSSYSKPGRQPWHSHEDASLFLALSGEKRDQGPVWGKPMGPMDLVYHAPDEPHFSEVGPGGLRGLNVDITSDWLAAHQIDRRDLATYRHGCDPGLTVSLMRLGLRVHYGVDSNMDWNAAEEHLVNFISPAMNTRDGGKPVWLARLLRHIRECPLESLQLRLLAADLKLHPVYLARAFRAQFGCSISDYVRRARVLDACRRCLDASIATGEAAHAAGFSDQSHFCRHFRREFGLRPGDLVSATKF